MSDLDSSILSAFLEAGKSPVSGDRLAKELGVSRVTIWTRLERLRSQGFIFEASTRKGYTLTSVPEALNEALVLAHLRRLKVTAEVEIMAEVDSTNSEAERRIALGREAPFFILAQKQTAGRGRLGRKWHSEHLGNLYLSLALRPFIPPDRLKPFTLWMGLALCAHLDEVHGVRLGLKWPNDLQTADGRKLAGMLTEARLDADTVRDLVFGLGLNVTAQTKDFPAELREVATSLAMSSKRPFEINLVAAQIVAALERAWDDFSNDRWNENFKNYWKRYDNLTGKTVTIQLRGKPVSGVVQGVDDDGSLILNDTAGQRMLISSGEVTLPKV